MEKIETLEKTESTVDAKEIIGSIPGIINRFEKSKNSASQLIQNVKNSSSTLRKAKNDDTFKRKMFGWSSETLLDFIIQSNNATHTSVSSISKLITNNNENSILLAEMIGKLAMLSALSFKNTSEVTTQLETMAKNFEKQSNNNTVQAGQIKKVVLAHLNKIKEEKEKADKIDSNFNSVNNNLVELNNQFVQLKSNYQNRIGSLEESLRSTKTENENILNSYLDLNSRMNHFKRIYLYSFLFLSLLIGTLFIINFY